MPVRTFNSLQALTKQCSCFLFYWVMFITKHYMRKTLKYKSTESTEVSSKHKKLKAKKLCRFGYVEFNLAPSPF